MIAAWIVAGTVAVVFVVMVFDNIFGRLSRIEKRLKIDEDDWESWK